MEHGMQELSIILALVAELCAFNMKGSRLHVTCKVKIASLAMDGNTC